MPPTSPCSQAALPADTLPEGKERRLPSGRSVVVKLEQGQEALEVRSPDGAVEVRITLTDAGPVVSLRGGRLEIDSPDTIALNCRNLELSAQGGARLHSGGAVQVTGQEMSVRTDGDIRMEGAIIRLN